MRTHTSLLAFLAVSALALSICGQSQAITWRAANTSATAQDLLQTATWSGGVPTSAQGAYFGGAQASTYTLSGNMSIGCWQGFDGGATTFDLGTGKTLSVVSAGDLGSGLGITDYGTPYVATVTVKSGTMIFTGADTVQIGYNAGPRVVGSRQHDFIVDGGTVNINGTWNGTGNSSSGALVVDQSGLVWVKAGSTMNVASTSRIRLGIGNIAVPYEGTLQIDGVLNCAGKLTIGEYRPGGTLRIGGTVNLTGTSTPQIGGGSQGNGWEPGSKILLAGGSIVATTHQSLYGNASSFSGAASPGLLMGTGVIDNLDVSLTVSGAAGTYKLAPGDASTTGTIEIKNGNFNENNGQIVSLKIGPTSADKLLLSTAGKIATIYNGINFSALGDLSTAAGNFDLVVAPTVRYGSTSTSLVIGSEVPTVTGDNLVAMLNGLGYTRVTGTAPGAGQFRYYVADAGNGMESVRVQFSPEPMTLSLLAIGGLAMLRRRAC